MMSHGDSFYKLISDRQTTLIDRISNFKGEEKRKREDMNYTVNSFSKLAYEKLQDIKKIGWKY